MKYKKEKFKYLGKQNDLLSHPDNSILDKHPNPHLNTNIAFVSHVQNSHQFAQSLLNLILQK